MDINQLRDNIDKLDHQIVELINERYKYVKGIGELKGSSNSAIYVPEREKSLLKKLTAINKGDLLTNETLQAIYREIMSGAIALERPLQIAFLGPKATFTHQAAIAKFGHSIELIAKSNIADVFNDIENGRVDYGCVPIENTTEGAVNHTLDMFMNSDVRICAEHNLRVQHSLLSNCKLSEIKTVYSHSQAIAQCRQWLLQNIPEAELIETASTAIAAKLASKQFGAAAIASELASEMYNIDILFHNIQDRSDNITRFMILGNQKTLPTGDDKTSICFSVHDRIGALYDCLLPFKEENITMSMIESRPSKLRNWEYFFFVDILGHRNDEKVQRAFDKLKDLCHVFRILGSYPRGIIED
ncbi:prephenate dehydratase [Lentisphaerota bacterium WC36G]|nr:prephenate dehydratase [Lentisphaerae bacterium WC36]